MFNIVMLATLFATMLTSTGNNLEITPDGASATMSAYSTDVVEFTVTNNHLWDQTYSFECVGSGSTKFCDPEAAQLTIQSQSSVQFSVTVYSRAAGAGTVELVGGNGAGSDSGYYEYVVT